jgi:DNA-binding transcriptional MerR regulator
MTKEKEYGIGEIQRMLVKDFPDITISKLRFLEKEGLVFPNRTESGYRKYTETNIGQIKYILKLQYEKYLPLAVIKKKIRDIELGRIETEDVLERIDDIIDVTESSSMDAVLSKLKISSEFVDELVDYKIIQVKEGPNGKYFSSNQVKILTEVKELSRYGVEPRHLHMFSQFANKGSSFIEQIFLSQLHHSDKNVRRESLRNLENLIISFQKITQALVKENLNKYLA